MKNPARWHRQFFPGTLDPFENKDSLVNRNVESTCYSTNIILQDVTPFIFTRPSGIERKLR